MNVATAIHSRMSCRASLATPIPKEAIVSILDTAKRAPSGGNLQPWVVHALTVRRWQNFLSIIRGKLPTQPTGEGAEYDIYPPNLHEPYRSRRFRYGEDMYADADVVVHDAFQACPNLAHSSAPGDCWENGQ